jgi:hypothetical protein
MIENYLVRLLKFLNSITSNSMPYSLMPAYVSTALHMAVIHILSVSELKGQRMSSGASLSVILILELARNLVVTSKSNS